mgnify:CR=1 FL=1
MKIICWLKTLIRSVNINTLLSGIYTSGHDYVEQENGELICKICNNKSIIK